MEALTWNQVRAHWLARNHLLEPVPSTQLVRVVSEVCGVQAQVLTAAELAVGSRVAGVIQQDIEDALWKARRLIKTYGPRGTLHLLPAEEAPMWSAAMRALLRDDKKDWFEQFNLSVAQGQSLFDSMRVALDHRVLTRVELADAVSQHLGPWARERLASTWADLVGVAALAGVLCFGPSQGNRVTFVRLDQWVSGWKELDPQEALKEVLRRYLAAYAPATPPVFAQWFGGKMLQPHAARQLFESLGERVVPVEVQGQRAWMLATDAGRTWGPVQGSLRLVPQYDCYLLGCRFGRGQLVPQAAKKRVFAFKNGRFEGAVGLPLLLIDGVVSGMWERRKRARRLEIRVEPFIRLTRMQREQLEAEAIRVGAFFAEQGVLTIGTLI